MSLEKLKKNPEVDIVLNSGDRIYIPSEKSTITVTGEVLAPTSFVFSKNLRVNDYIKLAGGLADSADKKDFVILPNGQAVRNLDSWRIGRSKIEPGSTIIVPREFLLHLMQSQFLEFLLQFSQTLLLLLQQ